MLLNYPRLPWPCSGYNLLFAVFKMKGRSLTVDTVWIFEKTVDRLADPRPHFEGVVLEYRHQVEVRRPSSRANGRCGRLRQYQLFSTRDTSRSNKFSLNFSQLNRCTFG